MCWTPWRRTARLSLGAAKVGQALHRPRASGASAERHHSGVPAGGSTAAGGLPQADSVEVHAVGMYLFAQLYIRQAQRPDAMETWPLQNGELPGSSPSRSHTHSGVLSICLPACGSGLACTRGPPGAGAAQRAPCCDRLAVYADGGPAAAVSFQPAKTNTLARSELHMHTQQHQHLLSNYVAFMTQQTVGLLDMCRNQEVRTCSCQPWQAAPEQPALLLSQSLKVPGAAQRALCQPCCIILPSLLDSACMLWTGGQRLAGLAVPSPAVHLQASHLDQLDFITAAEFDRLALLLRPLGRGSARSGSSPTFSAESHSPMETEGRQGSPFQGAQPALVPVAMPPGLQAAQPASLVMQAAPVSPAPSAPASSLRSTACPGWAGAGGRGCTTSQRRAGLQASA